MPQVMPFQGVIVLVGMYRGRCPRLWWVRLSVWGITTFAASRPLR